MMHSMNIAKKLVPLMPLYYKRIVAYLAEQNVSVAKSLKM